MVTPHIHAPERRTGIAAQLGAWALFAGAVASPAHAAPDEAGKVTLRFAWPDGLQAVVHQTKSISRTNAKGSESSSSKSSLESRARKVADGMVVSFGNSKIYEVIRNGGKPSSPDKAASAQLAGLPQPSYRINAEGELVGLTELAEFRQAMAPIFKAMMPPDTPPERWKKAFELGTSEQMLTSFASNEWNTIVGFWTGGASLVEGETYEITQEVPMPLLEGRTLRMLVRFKLVGQAACERPGVKTTCVDLELRSMPDPADLKRVVEEFVRKFQDKPAPSDALLAKAVGETYLRLRTEPDTLVPHAYQLRKEMMAKGDGEAAGMSVTKVEDVEVRYEYAPLPR